MHSLSADNRHIGRYIVQSADDRIYADYLQYRIGRISVSANFPNLDIVCTLGNLDLSKHSGDIAQTSFVALEGHYSKAMRVPLTKIAL